MRQATSQGFHPPATASAQRASAEAAPISHLNTCWKGQRLTPSSPEGCWLALRYAAGLPRILSKDNPRSRIRGKAALPGVGHSMGGRLLTTGAEQQPWCFFASVINHKDTGKVYSYSKQAASQSQRRREIPLSPRLLQGYFWKRQKPGEVFGSIPSLEPLQQSPGAAATKGRGRNLPPFFFPAKLLPAPAGGCAGRSCSPEKPVSPACLCFLLS